MGERSCKALGGGRKPEMFERTRGADKGRVQSERLSWCLSSLCVHAYMCVCVRAYLCESLCECELVCEVLNVDCEYDRKRGKGMGGLRWDGVRANLRSRESGSQSEHPCCVVCVLA